MDSKRIVGIVLVVIGVAIGVHTIVEPLYHVSSETHPYSPLWTILDPLMGLAIVLGLIVGYPRMKRASSAGPDAPVTWERLAATTMFYGFLGVGILFFWSWFNTMSISAGFAPGKGENVSALVWMIIDTLLPLLLGATGVSLLRDDA